MITLKFDLVDFCAALINLHVLCKIVKPLWTYHALTTVILLLERVWRPRNSGGVDELRAPGPVARGSGVDLHRQGSRVALHLHHPRARCVPRSERDLDDHPGRAQRSEERFGRAGGEQRREATRAGDCCFTLLQRTLQMRVFFHGVTGNVSEGVVNKKGQNVKQPHFQTMEDFVQESFLWRGNELH